jgi:LemA protein
MTFLLIFAAVLFVGFAIMALTIYNALISLRTQVDRAWANIDVILKQRYEELPQLIQAIEQYAGHESGVLQSLASARTNYGRALSVNDKITASETISVALRGVMALGEAYPNLKANQNFMQLQIRVSQLENAIADRREIYNEVVSNFNTRILQFPDVLAARFLSFERLSLYRVEDSSKTIPSLKMNLPKYNQGA